MKSAALWLQLLILLLSPRPSALQGLSSNATLKGFTGKESQDGVWLTATSRAVLDSKLTTVFLPVVYIAVFAVSLPTNAMAIWVFLFRTKKKHPSSIYMANLALCDLLFVIWIPLKIAYHLNGNDWIYGDALCKVLVGFFYGNMYCSTIFIACISVQRYWAIVHPLSPNKCSNAAAVAVSVAVWLAVWLLTTPLYLYDQTVKELNLNILTCHDITRPSQSAMAAGYFLSMGVVGYVIPAAVCVVAYSLMLRSLRNSTTDAAVARKRRRAVVLIVTVLVMFLLCFTPSNAMLLVHYSLLLAEAPSSEYGLYVSSLCLSSLNSCVDPCVYYFISKEFRDHVKNTLLCRSQRSVERMKVSFSALKYSRRGNAYTSDTQSNTQSSSC
ncbi:proteinase-activated receptor 2-like [Denticeps clupeoides]|uniref:G-protein coupled receptors family 1 profile domain-containing protein n=1 Tax=Denticeps clupeoides TaxID=299321 RepID=A0AAY4EMD1_9TELE|nr:proteinase-activated receptor 2-like [Denticeps clupeoides]